MTNHKAMGRRSSAPKTTESSSAEREEPSLPSTFRLDDETFLDSLDDLKKDRSRMSHLIRGITDPRLKRIAGIS